MAIRSEPSRIWLIAGPTASGKSALALRLARALAGEIVNADSMQIYAGLRVLTAAPTPDERALAPHHLFQCADAAEPWSVGRWLRAAIETLQAIKARGAPAIVVGGTGLYFRALTVGLARMPPTPADARRNTQTLWDELGEAAFRARLAQVDAAAEGRIQVGDRQRLTRALEVFAATGRPLTAWQAGAHAPLAQSAFRAVVMEPPRDALYARCDARLEGMAAEGALAEVAALVARGLPPSVPAMKALGVAAFAAHLAGRASLEEALAQAQLATRRYAKRQMTWFRGQAREWPRITAADEAAQWSALQAIARC